MFLTDDLTLTVLKLAKNNPSFGASEYSAPERGQTLHPSSRTSLPTDVPGLQFVKFLKCAISRAAAFGRNTKLKVEAI